MVLLDGFPLVDEFPLDPQLLYLNHAAVAPWPRRAAMAAQRFAEENLHSGATYAQQWLEQEQGLRQLAAKLLNAPQAEDIALVKNTSEALSMVAFGLNWQPGDKVVITDQEFPSNRIPWEALSRKGVKLVTAKLDQAETPEAAIAKACTTNTKLISVSSVQYASGLRMDLKAIGALARQHQALYCVDAIQSLGALTFDVESIGADFVMADAHKWLLGPEGIALFYSHPKARTQLKLYEYGWHMVEALGDYDRHEWQPAASARRFECGSPNTLGIVTLKGSLSLLLEIGISNVEQRVIANQRYLRKRLEKDSRIQILTSDDPKRQSGILHFRIKDKNDDYHKALYQSLLDQQLICAYRHKGIRLSPHFYTPEPVLDKAVSMIRNAL
jgi:cysteine desulfurase/selenocysteine lyase